MDERRKIFGFYAPYGFTVYWERYKKICEARGLTASKMLRQHIHNVVGGFEEETPQQVLDDYSGDLDKVPVDDITRIADELCDRVDQYGISPTHKDVIDRLMHIPDGRIRVQKAKQIELLLKERGVPVLY